MATGGRKTQLPLLHEISRQLTFASALQGLVGVLPAGAILHSQHIATTTGFNATTASVAIGSTPGGADIVGAVSILAAARADGNSAAGITGPYPVDTPFYYTLAFTGPAPTAGLVTVWFDYLPGVG